MKRNWKWFVPAAAILVILLMVAGILCNARAFIGIVDKAVKSDPVYTATEAKARSDPRVIAALGEPLRDGAYIKIRMYSGTPRKEGLNIELVGPKDRADLKAEAVKSDGQWEFLEMEVTVRKTGQQIDLLTPQE
jgi:hypothetical protein